MTSGHPQHGQPCAARRLRLEAFVDGELAPIDAELLRTHLRDCPACLAEVRALAELNQGLSSLATGAAPPLLWDRIGAALDLETTRGGQPDAPGLATRPFSRRSALALAASLATVVAGATFLLQPDQNAVVTASVQDFITYRARGWTVDHAASDARSLTQWAQARVTFAVPTLKERLGPFEVGGVRLCWLLNRRLLGLTYASGEGRAVVYVMEAKGLALPAADQTLPDGRRAAVQHVKGHGVAVWSESDLVFVLVAAEQDFARVLRRTGQRADRASRGPQRTDRDTS